MPRLHIDVRDDARPELDAFLVDRIHEFNARVTGIDDAALLVASLEDDDGEVVGGVSGHTWGGCCVIALLWVHESRRGRGVGTALMQAAEREAIRRGCRQIVLTTHSFQAPRFYERLGFEALAVVPDNPRGHADIVYVKDLRETPGP